MIYYMDYIVPNHGEKNVCFLFFVMEWVQSIGCVLGSIYNSIYYKIVYIKLL